MTTINNIATTANSVASTDNFILQDNSNVTKKVAFSVLSTTLTPSARQITVNGITYDLSADRTFTVSSVATLTTPRKIGGVSFDGSADIEQPYIISGYYPGVPGVSEIILSHNFVVDTALPSSLTGSWVSAKVAATAQTVFDIQKSGVSIGSITFAASGTTATFTFNSNVSFTGGTHYLDIIAPASPDATLANISFALKGTRS